MRILANSLSIISYKGVNNANKGLHESMRKLSSGKKLERPGDAPADFGISQRLQFQIRNSAESRRNLDNARYLINTADEWLQVSTDILRRMSEISVSATDASKSSADRQNLDTEFQQLKGELSRISKEAKYNGIQVSGRDQLLSYDEDQETFFFSQFDGGEKYTLPVKVLSGLQSDNKQDFLFDSSKPYTLSYDGSSIWYADSNNNLTNYQIQTGDISRDTSDSNSKGLEIDDIGRLWYASETAPGSGIYGLAQQDLETWSTDTTLIGPGDINDMASTEFAVYENRVTYLNTGGDIVSRSLHQINDLKVELASTDLTFASTAGQFTVSEDGLYMADVPAAGSVRITNMETKESHSLTIPTAFTVSSLQFSADAGELMYVDSVEGAIHRISVATGDSPALSQDTKVHMPSGATGFTGLSLEGSSHRSIFRIHNGPDSGQQSQLTTGDVRLYTLGLTKSDVLTGEAAQKSLSRTQEAINRLTVQRANLGAEASTLDHLYGMLQNYSDSISQSEDSITSTDVAAETAVMADLQIRQQAAIAMLSQANQISRSVLSLLQR
jgi:flagellin